MRRPLAVLILLLSFLAAPIASGQEPADAPESEPVADPIDGDGEADPAPPAVPTELPADPADRLKMAQAAFRRADYALLVPLLEPLAGPESPLQAVAARVEAGELLVVGFFFLAQQVTKSEERDQLLDSARAAALALLRERPDHVLDTLIFPVSVVDLFEAVRRDNSEELSALLAERNNGAGEGETQTVYLERIATQHVWWVNFLPMGAGQFQNGHLVKGTAFAFLQAAGLALDITAYWMIVRLRNPATGRFDTEGGLSSDLASARRWRQALYGGLAGFAAMWVISAVDGWLNFERETVRIRTLDAPPPELGGAGASDAGLRLGLPLGLAVEFSW